jgi:hypothetical protein
MKGECTYDWITNHWHKEYRGLEHRFYKCMKEFELLYQCEDDPRLNMIPLRFGHAAPAISWTKNKKALERTIKYKFDKKPPAGIMSRFIVKTHHMIAKSNGSRRDVYWRNGVFLRTGEGDLLSEALCEFKEDDREIIFTVRAAYPQAMIEQLHAYAKALFSFFKGLKPRRFYGCKLEDETPCPFYHSDKLILNAIVNNVTRHYCEEDHYVTPLKLVCGFTSFTQPETYPEELRKILRDELDKEPEWSWKIGSSIKDVVWRIDDLIKKFEPGVDIDAKSIQLGQQYCRELLGSLAQLLDSRDFTPIPSVFTITPVERGKWNPRKIFEMEYRWTPFCEHEMGFHNIGFSVPFRAPRNWWYKSAPYLRLVIKLLVLSAGIGLIALPVTPAGELVTSVQGDIDIMKEMIDKIPELEGGADTRYAEPLMRSFHETIHRMDFDELLARPDLQKKVMEEISRRSRMIMAKLLEEIDPGSYKAQQWGELQRVLMPDNSYRWLCKKHREELK